MAKKKSVKEEKEKRGARANLKATHLQGSAAALAGDFKPGSGGAGGGGSPDSPTPSNPKKKRRTSNPPPSSQGPPSTPPSNDLVPPPLTGYGDTIVASNPFDDSPSVPSSSGMPHMPPMNMPYMHNMSMGNMNMKSMSMGPHMNGPMGGPMNGPMGGPMGGPMSGPMGGPMGPGGHMGPGGPMNGSMGSRGHMSGPMGPGGSINSPMNGPNMGPGSGMKGPSMGPGGGMSSPMNGSMNSPMNSPMNGGMNMNSMNGITSMNCAMSMNSGGGMNSMSPMTTMCGMNGPMSSMSCSMSDGPVPNMGQKPMPVSSGKVYPADQPMVFNPQNPNAPPIYPCGICHKEVHDNDQAILCESGCNFWFHRVCTGLTEGAYQMLTTEVYAEWVCDKCLNSKNIPLVKFKP